MFQLHEAISPEKKPPFWKSCQCLVYVVGSRPYGCNVTPVTWRTHISKKKGRPIRFDNRRVDDKSKDDCYKRNQGVVNAVILLTMIHLSDADVRSFEVADMHNRTDSSMNSSFCT